MDKTIEIERQIDQKMGNKMIFDKIRSGAYRLKTGEANRFEIRKSLYSEKFDNEFEQIINEIDKEEDLNLHDHEIRREAKNIQRQMSEGRRKLTMRFREKEKLADEEEGKPKRKKLFF